ncbi:putative secologanin synthase [Helianthus annuus]|nr:putative secologanin synthase [Helianthus annuus]
MEVMSMSMSVVYCGVAVAAVAVAVYAWRFLNWVWLRPKAMEKSLREQGLNGNPYKFLFGDLKEMVQMSHQAKLKPIKLTDSIVPRVMPFNYASAKTYGSIFFTWLGPRPLVHVTEPPLIRQILANYNQFQKPRGGNPLTKMLARGLADADADQWVKHRKIINPAFHVEKLKHMLPAFHISCSEMINKWEGITKGKSGEVDVYPHLQTMTSDVISRTAFGSSYEEGRRIFELQVEQAKLVIKAAQSMYIPGSRFLPTKRNRRMKQIDREVKSSIKKIIHKRLKETGESTKQDLLGLLLDSNNKEIKQQGNSNFGLSIDEVIEECKLFYFAGQETTANLLVWTMILLSQHTNWQDRARDEVLKLFGDRKPDIDGLNHLKTINMILHEVLRLYPPGVALGRMIHEETKVGDLTLPSGSQLMLHLMLLHYDADIWGDDVNEFNPERFAEGVSKATKGHATYFPFGGGPRICIGQTFALLEAKLALVMILRRFSFELSPSYAHAPHTIITLQPQFGAQLILSEL